MRHINHKKIQGGFTVIEALVAIAILLIAVTGAFSVAQSSLQSTNFVKNRVTAYYLAQEGVEYIRHLRDNNGLGILRDPINDPPSWLSGIDSECSTACTVNVTSSSNETPAACGGGICSNLLFDKDTSGASQTGGQFLYGSPSGTLIDSGFKRTIKITPVNLDEVTVTSTVSWYQYGTFKSVVVSENLYNWQSL